MLQIYRFPIAFFGYGILCLITAMMLGSTTKNLKTGMIPASGGEFGPITTEKDNQVVKFSFYQNVPLQKWSGVDVEVLDADKEYLFAFGEELWHESGRDSDGYWEESKEDMSLSVTFPKPGTYYLDISSEGNYNATGDRIRVSASAKRGSSVAFIWLGFISLILGAAVAYFQSQ